MKQKNNKCSYLYFYEKKNKCSYLYIYFCVSLSAGNTVFKLKRE